MSAWNSELKRKKLTLVLHDTGLANEWTLVNNEASIADRLGTEMGKVWSEIALFKLRRKKTRLTMV